MDAPSVVASLLHELGVPDAALSLLLAHARAVAREADRLGLVAERSLEEILLRHTADSLLFALVRRPAPGERWVDVGSGAGFPGLVLACAFPETSFLLLEPQQRRAGFLELQVMTLGLAMVGVERTRIERLPEESADVVVTRALEEPKKTFPLLTSPLRPGGIALVAAGADTPLPEGASARAVDRPGVDSPGVVLMIARG